jgi:Domain of unknown function (DUF3459)
MTMLDLGEHVVAYRRGDGEDALVVAVNFADTSVTVAEPGELGTLLLSSEFARPAGEPFDGTLAGSEAVVLAASSLT